MTKTYHVAINGSDQATGSIEEPFQTIQRAADAAKAGDTIIVHEGTYREWVRPRHSGTAQSPITYTAAKGDRVIIKGSEIVSDWTNPEGTLWRLEVPNSLFGNSNPYDTVIYGDWFIDPKDRYLHTGEVYLNGRSFYEARTLEEVKNPSERSGYQMPLSSRVLPLLHPEDSVYQWFAEVKEDTTVIYANFHDHNPNKELTEINVRQCCFYPETTGIDYITVSGFEMAHAATPWTPPTSNQVGMVGPNWAKGWVIENNHLHDAKCSAVSLGKEASTGDSDCARHRTKSAYQYQLEATFKALNMGWSKESIGSHTVCNNLIHDCGQNGIVGNLGCIFSQVYGNHIYRIGVKHEFFGWEIAGIKFHAPIDTYIHKNRIHDCTLGLWLDWQAQGTRVSSNLLYRNNQDCNIEVTHGPMLFDNNIFASDYNFDNHAQGTAFVNNLFCGAMGKVKIMNRATPYHLPHSTRVAGYSFVYGGDDRYYNNLFVGSNFDGGKHFFCGTEGYRGSAKDYAAYISSVADLGCEDEEVYARKEQPAYMDCNVYMKGAKGWDSEENQIRVADSPEVRIIEEGNHVYLEITLGDDIHSLPAKIQTTQTLGKVRLVDMAYEAPDGKPLTLDRDFLGNQRSSSPTPGPVQEVTSGFNRITLC